MITWNGLTKVWCTITNTYLVANFDLWCKQVWYFGTVRKIYTSYMYIYIYIYIYAACTRSVYTSKRHGLAQQTKGGLSPKSDAKGFRARQTVATSTAAATTMGRKACVYQVTCKIIPTVAGAALVFQSPPMVAKLHGVQQMVDDDNR